MVVVVCGHVWSFHSRAWSYVVIHGRAWSCMVVSGHVWSSTIVHGNIWSYEVMRGHMWSRVVMDGGEWLCMVRHGRTLSCVVVNGQAWSYMAVVTSRATSLCPRLGAGPTAKGTRMPPAHQLLGAASRMTKSETRLSKEFIWSQGWQSIKGKLCILQSNPGLIYVCLKDVN